MSLYQTIDIRFADPVSAIAMNKHFIVTGSMMGRLTLTNMTTKKTHLLSELSSENITGINFEEETLCNIAVGDEEVLKYNFDLNSNNHDFKRYPNYQNEGIHKSKCQNMFTLFTDNKLLLLELNQELDSSGNINIISSPTPLKIKDMETGNVREYQINMTNYSVPFDFTGTKFLWVEFLSDKERNICLFDSETELKHEFPLTKEYGHISFARIYKNNTIILVKSLNIIEIREMDQNFSLKQSFISKGDEVIAMDIYSAANHNKTLHAINNINNINNNDKISKLEIDNIKNDNNIIGLDKNQELAQIQIDNPISKIEDNKLNMKQEETSDSTSLYVVLVDIDGNINVIDNFTKIETKFNMYQIKDIPQDTKDKQFFSMGYPYYIHANKDFYVISTDYGVFVFSINKSMGKLQ